MLEEPSVRAWYALLSHFYLPLPQLIHLEFQVRGLLRAR